ncbi:hypothetical protein FACS1894130_11400 [Spirochaetia bacterium]|nr:hypothetical protein FACS1894130_11400 [Spirochaetia bacterium]
MPGQTKEIVEIIAVERNVSMPPWKLPMQQITIKRANGAIETRVDNEVGLGPVGGGAGCRDPGRDWEKEIGTKEYVTLRDNVLGKRIENWININ